MFVNKEWEQLEFQWLKLSFQCSHHLAACDNSLLRTTVCVGRLFDEVWCDLRMNVLWYVSLPFLLLYVCTSYHRTLYTYAPYECQPPLNREPECLSEVITYVCVFLWKIIVLWIVLWYVRIFMTYVTNHCCNFHLHTSPTFIWHMYVHMFVTCQFSIFPYLVDFKPQL